MSYVDHLRTQLDVSSPDDDLDLGTTFQNGQNRKAYLTLFSGFQAPENIYTQEGKRGSVGRKHDYASKQNLRRSFDVRNGT